MNQDSIKKWFDNIYNEKGFKYLRPIEAYNIFLSIMNPEKGKRVLDIACGLGLMLKVMERTELDLHGIDISDVAVRKARQFCRKAKFITGNAEQLPYPDDYFDYITLLGSLERMLDREAVLREIRRVTTNEARICLMVRNSEHFLWRFLLKPLDLWNKEGHQDAQNLTQWKTLFDSNGFEVLKVLPDHWPYFWLMKMIPFIKVDVSRVIEFPFSIKNAYEFIFILCKK